MEAINLPGAQECVEEGGAGLACEGHARNGACQRVLPKRGVVTWVEVRSDGVVPGRTHRQNNGHPEREEIPFRPLLRHGA